MDLFPKKLSVGEVQLLFLKATASISSSVEDLCIPILNQLNLLTYHSPYFREIKLVVED